MDSPAVDTARYMPYDVLVAGGGMAGIAAAIASARGGARTILVEQAGWLGGMGITGATGLHSFFNVFDACPPAERTRVVAGIAQELVDRTGEVPWGQVFTARQVQEAITRDGPFKVVGIVHAETSTGAAQPIEEISRVVHEAGGLLLADTVTSLAGMEVNVDGWAIDACYSGTQKCLSCPPGLSPVTFSPAAEEVIATRKTKVQSWYLDMNMVRQYWGTERLYHHTAPVNMIYALHEALRLVLEEGLAARWQRHLRCHRLLKAELEAMGIRLLADPAHQLPMLNAVAAPEGVDEAAVRRRLLAEHDIEIGGGLGAFKGKAWRIGLMGESATERNVRKLVDALRQLTAPGR